MTKKKTTSDAKTKQANGSSLQQETKANGDMPKQSAYFKISIYDVPDYGGDEVCFVYKNGQPDKIGDGSYGSVYRGMRRGTKNTSVAIKLLYNNITNQLRQLHELNNGELTDLTRVLATERKIAKNCIPHVIEVIRANKDDGYRLPTKVQEVLKSNDCAVDASEFLNELLQRANSSAIERFHREVTITRDLLEHIRAWPNSDSNVDEIEGIVDVKGGTTTFREYTKVGGPLEDVGKYFEREKINISNYALVMDLYTYSLKDLLERPDKTGNSKSGYQLLKEMSHDNRARESLLLLTKVADGISKLHNAGGAQELYLHRDIKPGNIFIKNTYTPTPGADEKVRKLRGGFKVALGDLGSLPDPLPDPTERGWASHTMWSRPIEYGYARGTQHYRSPEQKYFKDVADAQIVFWSIKILREKFPDFFAGQNDARQIIENNDKGSSSHEKKSNAKNADIPESDEKRVVLIVQDPKFKNTLFNKDDIVILSKDSSHKQYKIDYIIPFQFLSSMSNNQTEDSGEVERHIFVLTAVDDQATIKEDDKTQVEFYKRQSYRTDLFGVGAVLFDMLTIGHSAEQFYESIRKYEGTTVERIVDQYDALTKGEMETENPDFGEIFKPFRHHRDNSYPDTKIIKFLLQCMLYQSGDTFYGQNKAEPWKASSTLFTELSILSKEYNEKQKELTASQSMLIHGFEPPLPTGTSTRLSEKIDMLQGLTKWDDVDGFREEVIAANRLLYGGYYFWQVTNHVRDVVRSLGQEKDTEQQTPISQNVAASTSADSKDNTHRGVIILRQMLPTSFSLQLPDSVGPATIGLEGVRINLLEDIVENRLELLIRSAANSFVAAELAGMRRNIVLFIPNAQGQRPHRLQCWYWFQDASSVNRQIVKEDWIDFDEQLWIVVENPTNNELIIERDFSSATNVEDESRSNQNSNSDQSDRYVEAKFIAKINPIKYYLEMLGIHLQHLIFTYSPITTTTRDRVDVRALLKTYGIGSDLAIMKISDSEWDPATKLEEVYERYIDMMIRLTLHEAEGSYYHQISSNSQERSNTQETGKLKTVFDVFNSEIQSTAGQLYEYIVKDVLKIPIGNIADHPDQPLTPDAFPQELTEFKKMFDELRKNPVDIENKIIESDLIEGGPFYHPRFNRPRKD